MGFSFCITLVKMKKQTYLLILLFPVLSLFGEEQFLEIEREKSKIDVHVNVKFRSFVANLTRFHAEILVEPESLNITKAEFKFDFGDLKTGNKLRDKHMLKWMEYSTFPQSNFVLNRIREEGGMLKAVGKLTFHNEEHEIEFPFEFKREGAKWSIEANAVIDYRNWGLKIITFLFFIKVDPNVKVIIHLEGTLEEAI